MVQAPSCSPRNWCVADRAEPALFIPDIAKCTSAPKCFPHVISFAVLEVGFAGRVVGIGFAFNLDVSLDGRAFGVVQPESVGLSLSITGFAKEGPVTVPTAPKVFRFEPVWIFFLVPSACPLPQTEENGVIDASKSAFAHYMPMIVGPTTDLGVELLDQSGGRHAPGVFDGLSDSIQEGFHIFLGGRDAQFPVGVPTHILSEKIKAFLHVCNDRLFRREFEPSLLQKLFNDGLDLSFQ